VQHEHVSSPNSPSSAAEPTTREAGAVPGAAEPLADDFVEALRALMRAVWEGEGDPVAAEKAFKAACVRVVAAAYQRPRG
jgi:hypothetical protein